jgi:hypothetical protein
VLRAVGAGGVAAVVAATDKALQDLEKLDGSVKATPKP